MFRDTPRRRATTSSIPKKTVFFFSAMPMSLPFSSVPLSRFLGPPLPGQPVCPATLGYPPVRDVWKSWIGQLLDFPIGIHGYEQGCGDGLYPAFEGRLSR